MEPFNPIPGKPPRKVVIDRQRKLFASLDIEELLVELVSGCANIVVLIMTNYFVTNYNLGHRLPQRSVEPVGLAAAGAVRRH
jgi:hypothetical protein